MDEMLLIEAVERYLKGEMSSEEKAFFEGLRKKDPEVDQLVVEHTYFLQGLETFGTKKAFKHSLQEVEAKLIEEGLIGQSPLSGKAKVIFLWKKYRAFPYVLRLGNNMPLSELENPTHRHTLMVNFCP